MLDLTHSVPYFGSHASSLYNLIQGGVIIDAFVSTFRSFNVYVFTRFLVKNELTGAFFYFYVIINYIGRVLCFKSGEVCTGIRLLLCERINIRNRLRIYGRTVVRRQY